MGPVTQGGAPDFPAALPSLGDPRFFRRAGPYALAEIEARAGAVGSGAVTGAPLFEGVAPLQSAGPAQIGFLHNPRYIASMKTSRAGAILVSSAQAALVPATAIALVVADPYAAWARVAAMFHPAPPANPGVHSSAVVAGTARVDASAQIGPNAVLGESCEIGAFCRVGAGAVIGDGVVLGRHCRVGASASISHALVGARVYIYPGARIGQEGFGFAITPQGFVTVPQLGRVVIGDDVEIGANSAVDRGAAADTVIGPGTRIDNLVQIGHGVRIGRGCVIVAQVGIAGSAEIGDFVQIGGQVAIAGHLRIGDHARIGAQAGVISDVPARAELLGSPALPVREFFRNVAVLRRLARRQGASGKAAGGTAGEDGAG